MSFSTTAMNAANSGLPFAGHPSASKVAAGGTSRATLNCGGINVVKIPSCRDLNTPDRAYHRDASRTFLAVCEANKPYKAAAEEIG
jgi:hypothetical protein